MIKHWIVSLLCGGIEHNLNLRFFNDFLRSVKELVSILLGCCHDYVLKRYWIIWFRDPRELKIWIAMSWVWISQSWEAIRYSWINIYLFFFIILSRETIRYLSFYVDHLWFSILFYLLIMLSWKMRLWSDGNIQWGEVALDIFCHLMETLKHGDEHIWNILYSKQNSLQHSASVHINPMNWLSP